ncbi:MAG TPA: aldehyde dehydrogenase family protein, partial [bacterium]|nr:aldehyde dehydrogenase family protein [bacterium]
RFNITFHQTKWSDEEGGRIYRHDVRALQSYRADAQTSLEQWRFWEKVRCPVLLIHGLLSDALQVRTIERMKRYRPIEVMHVPDTGHTPVLSVIKVKNIDEAITVLNGTKYGLSSSVYTKDVNNSFKAMRDIKTGITYINAPTIGAEAHLPFGGVKATGNGHREGGWPVFDFYSETKTVYVDYSDKLQRAQIDNY